jgi:hypothetical protein
METGFDRMRFRGTLRSISYVDALDKWLSPTRVRSLVGSFADPPFVPGVPRIFAVSW